MLQLEIPQETRGETALQVKIPSKGELVWGINYNYGTEPYYTYVGESLRLWIYL